MWSGDDYVLKDADKTHTDERRMYLVEITYHASDQRKAAPLFIEEVMTVLAFCVEAFLSVILPLLILAIDGRDWGEGPCLLQSTAHEYQLLLLQKLELALSGRICDTFSIVHILEGVIVSPVLQSGCEDDDVPAVWRAELLDQGTPLEAD